MDTLNIAIVGLGLTRINQLKQCLRDVIPSHINLCWCNIAHNNLHLVVIQAAMLELNNVQNILSRNIATLKIGQHTDPLNPEQDIFQLPCENLTQLQTWIKHNVLNQELSSSTHAQQKTIRASTHYLHHLYRLDQPLASPEYLADQHGEVYALIDHKQQVWVTKDHFIVDFDCSYLTRQHAELSRVISIKHQAKSTYNLFQLLWNSAYFHPENKTYHKQQAFKLLHWPQPLKESDYRHILKLSAFFSLGASIQEIMERTDIQLETIYRFLYASEQCNCLIEIPAKESRFYQNPQNATESNNPISKFFSKLRHRLGL